MPARKHYVTNKNLVPEIIKSQEQGELTKEAIKMLISISERAIAKLRYKDPEDRRDCLAFAQMDLFKYWDRFNVEKSNNAFAYYTQIAKKGYAKGWNKLHPKKYSGTIRMSGGGEEGTGIYSL
jgi:hypothetical protein|tara:strand:- start:366 stop:734 length:369 start_codon:yes stop_codon:yes gene_type:complete